MSDETRRPGSVGGVPMGTRARNRTTVLGPDRIDSLRTNFERAAVSDPAPNRLEPEETVDASALDIFGAESAQGNETSADPMFEEIFGAHQKASEVQPRSRAQDDFYDPFADVLDEAPVVKSVEESPSATLEFSGQDYARPEVDDSASASVPKILRPVSPRSAEPSQTRAQVPDDRDDPFSSLDEDLVAQPQYVTPPQPEEAGDIDDMFGALPDFEESPHQGSLEAGPPKIVKVADVAAVQEQVFAPPQTLESQPIRLGPVTPSEVAPINSQTRREVEIMQEPRDEIHWKSDSPLVGFLVTYDHDPKGSYVELRQGRLMVSNQREESGSCLVVLGESVSPMHAIMRVGLGGVVQVLDQLSESGTRVKHMGQVEEVFLSGEKSTLSHGDVVFFGDRKFHVLLVVGHEDTE